MGAAAKMTFEDWAEPYKSGEKPIPDHIHDWLREAWDSGKVHATPKWQPIETSPKDGTDVLIFAPCGRMIARFMKYNGLKSWRDWDLDPQEPTHWMPLPEPPTEDDNDIL